jgi:RHS repeat-associated protein
MVWKAVYTPFGEAVASIQTVENPFRFPGQYYDPETGLHYNYFRYYNPQTGRYMTPDPIGLEGGINLYLYLNDPINWADPLGLKRVHVLPSWIPTFNPVYPNWFITFSDWWIPINASPGSTKPDPSRDICKKGCPEIESGTYPYFVDKFPYREDVPEEKKYPAPRLGTVPSQLPNPNNNNQKSMTGVWVHKGGRTSTGSEGCLTIDPKYWNDFMGNFPLGSKGNLTVW